MKHIIVSRMLMILYALSGLMLQSCGRGSDPSPDVYSLLQGGTWKVKRVTVDGINRSDMFSGLTVSFAASGFSATHGGLVWPASGTWSKNADNTSLTRNDGVIVSIDNVTDVSLELSFTWKESTMGRGRSRSISGEHIFVFER